MKPAASEAGNVLPKLYHIVIQEITYTQEEPYITSRFRALFIPLRCFLRLSLPGMADISENKTKVLDSGEKALPNQGLFQYHNSVLRQCMETPRLFRRL